MINIIKDKKIYKESQTEVIVCPISCNGYKDFEPYSDFLEVLPEIESFINEKIEEGSVELGSNIYLRTQPEIRIDIMLIPVVKTEEDSCSIRTIETAMEDMLNIVKELDLKSIAVPALGCGFGGLDFETQVRPVYEKYFGELEDVTLEVYL